MRLWQEHLSMLVKARDMVERIESLDFSMGGIEQGDVWIEALRGALIEEGMLVKLKKGLCLRMKPRRQ